MTPTPRPIRFVCEDAQVRALAAALADAMAPPGLEICAPPPGDVDVDAILAEVGLRARPASDRADALTVRIALAGDAEETNSGRQPEATLRLDHHVRPRAAKGTRAELRERREQLRDVLGTFFRDLRRRAYGLEGADG